MSQLTCMLLFFQAGYGWNLLKVWIYSYHFASRLRTQLIQLVFIAIDWWAVANVVLKVFWLRTRINLVIHLVAYIGCYIDRVMWMRFVHFLTHAIIETGRIHNHIKWPLTSCRLTVLKFNIVSSTGRRHLTTSAAADASNWILRTFST